MGEKTTRREFLKQVALTGAALSSIPGIAKAAEGVAKGQGGKSKVVITTNAAVLKGESQISQSVLEKMLDKNIAKLTSTSTAADGWKKLFTPNDVVGIKVNCLFGKGVATHPEVVQAVVRGLKLAGVKEDNIIIWDRSTGDLIKSGFTPNKDGNGVKCYGDDGDWGEEIQQGSFKGRITKVISKKITAMINVPILKTHGISGISCCLKNHYGSFDNPGNHHENFNTAVADFSAIPVVKDKTKLVVVDALRPQYDGGPGLKPEAQFNYYSIITSTDPLAADAVGVQIIEQKRKQMKLEDMPKDKLVWLKSAEERGVGISDLSKIDVIRV